MKRGVSQLDWIISLALFVLYIGWFFIFIQPNISFTTNQNSMMVLLIRNFDNEYNWQINKIPIFVESNVTPSVKPVFLNFSKSKIKFEDDRNFISWKGNLIFLANLTNKISSFFIFEGIDHSFGYKFVGLNSEPNWASTTNITINFDDSLPDKVQYDGKIRLDNSKYRVNDIDLNPDSFFHNDSGFVAFYNAEFQNINHTSMIFAQNPEIFNFLTSKDLDANYNFKIFFDLFNYTAYYSNNVKFGNFEYKKSVAHLTYSDDYITLYDNFTAMSMFFDSVVTFNFTSFNNSLSVDISFPVSGFYNYKVLFHSGNFTSLELQGFDVRIGANQPLTGIFLDNITSNYSLLKSEWNFPRNFDILIYTNTSANSFNKNPLIEIKDESPGRRNVFALVEDKNELTKEGLQKPLAIRYRIW